MRGVTFVEGMRSMLDDGPVVLATVLETDGSVPRQPGAMMAVSATRHLGTVGGGAMEGRILADIRVVLDGGAERTVDIDLGGVPNAVRDGICGGRMRVGIRRLAPQPEVVLDEIIRDAHDGIARWLRLQPGEAGVCTDLWGGHPLTPDWILQDAEDGGAWRMRIRPRPVLLVVGGGHCGEALARQAAFLDYDVVVQDDRDDVRAALEAAALPRTRVAPGPTEATLASIGVFPPTGLDVALVTRSFAQDVEALAALHAAPEWPRTVGVMGSRRRLGTVMQMLRERGWTADDVARLDAPIGIDLGAETPEEIAVSIAAGLVAAERRAARALAEAQAATDWRAAD